MNLQHLRYFQVLARSDNYQKASQKLYVTQPTLSRAIASLEDEIGVSLFQKAGRNVKITPSGVEFLSYVDEALSAIDRGIDRLRAANSALEGNIRISCIYAFTHHHLPKIISEFNRIYPNVQFLLEPATTQLVISEIHNGNADIGIHCASSHMTKYQDLEYDLVLREEIVLIVPKEHRLANRAACSLLEVRSEPIISFAHRSGMLFRTKEMFEALHLEFNPQIYVSDDQAILNMVKSGIAVACVLRNIVADEDNVAILTINDDIDKMMDIFIALKKREYHSALLETFKQFVLQHSA